MKHNKRISRHLVPRAGVIALLSLCMCDAPVEDDLEHEGGSGVAEDELRIINGSPVGNNDRGVVQVTSNSGLCTGTMLNHWWVLTAAHCVDIAPQNGVNINLNGTNRQSQSIILHPSLDVALVALGQSMPVNGQVTGYSRAIYTGTNDSLDGQFLDCWGFGRNTFNGGPGTLRRANLEIVDTDDEELEYDSNVLGQIQWRGDSGGTCFVSEGSELKITGVNSTASFNGGTVTAAHQTGPQAFRDWALNAMTGIRPALSLDVDGDGNKDVLFTPEGGPGVGLHMVTALSDANAKFSTRVQRLGDGNGIWNKGEPLVADIDGDGRDDVVFPWYVNGSGLQIRTKRSNGDGTWASWSHQLTDGSGIWNQNGPVVADVDGDGRDDIVFPFTSNGLEIRTKFSNGNGTFTAASQTLGDGSGIWNRGAPLVADVNGDDLDDLVFAWYVNGSGLQIRTKLSNGDGTWTGKLQQFTDGDGIWNQGQPMVADIDGDSDDDIVFAWSSASGLQIRTKRSNADGTYSSLQHQQTDGSGIWNQDGPVIADIDNDGRDDIVFPFYVSGVGLQIRTKFSDGDGTWTHAAAQFPDGSGVWNRGGPLFGDFSSGGDDDIVFPTSAYGRISLRAKRSNGTGQFTAVTSPL